MALTLPASDSFVSLRTNTSGFAHARIINTLVRQIVADWESGYRILELGCGTGNVLRVLKQACPHGMVMGLDGTQPQPRHA